LNEAIGVVRNGKQCRERWYNFLNPEINRDPFTVEEDLEILKKRKQIGNRWSEIVKSLPGRTENNVKNRFNCLYKKVKDEMILKLQNSSTTQDAISRMNEVNQEKAEGFIDEDEVIDILIA